MSLGILVNYIDRVNISHALVPISAELHLSPVERGVLFSAFSWGYVALMGIGGLLIDRYGAIRMSATAACAWSLSTLLSGLAWNFSSILVSRFAVGIGEAARVDLIDRGAMPPDAPGSIGHGVRLPCAHGRAAQMTKSRGGIWTW